jgi:hypothetical protein
VASARRADRRAAAGADALAMATDPRVRVPVGDTRAVSELVVRATCAMSAECDEPRDEGVCVGERLVSVQAVQIGLTMNNFTIKVVLGPSLRGFGSLQRVRCRIRLVRDSASGYV